jgi:hypothetical protein
VVNQHDVTGGNLAQVADPGHGRVGAGAVVHADHDPQRALAGAPGGQRHVPLAHHQHRAGRLQHGALGDAAEQQPRDRPSPMSAHQDQVRALGPGELGDHLLGKSEQDLLVNHQPVGPQC